ncbi:MAG: CDP-alcohol phosphatidyltransferase family protein [Planctomycetes bacterium]|nr:CDP-alcohol phosphatidyltransferase family protein [Planctomycetota bacterium]
MSRRVSDSVLDPWIAPAVPHLYRALHLPRALPPEAIVIAGHIVALLGAVGFALSTSTRWGGFLAAAGVLGNHLCDMVDGTHARRTGQCRNGGELLDHFFDPLSFSAWMIGLGWACGRTELAIVGILFVYATAVLTNIRAKMTGEFRLSKVGPTEFKALLALFGTALGTLAFAAPDRAVFAATVGFTALCVAGAAQLVVGVVRSVRAVDRDGAKPDTSEWEWRGASSRS